MRNHSTTGGRGYSLSDLTAKAPSFLGEEKALFDARAAVKAGVVYADWAESRRAERYRVWKKVTGVDNDFLSAATVTDSDATLTGLPGGATVEIQVTAVNDAGESSPGTAGWWGEPHRAGGTLQKHP